MVFQQVLSVDLFEVQFVTGLGEVAQGCAIRCQRFRLFRELGFVKEIGYSCRYIGWFLTDRNSYALCSVALFKVVRAFRMRFRLAIDDHQVKLDAAIRGQHHATIPPAIRCWDPFGEIDFAVGHRGSFLILVSV